MAIEIVDLPISKMIFHSYVNVPEGTIFQGRNTINESFLWLIWLMINNIVVLLNLFKNG